MQRPLRQIGACARPTPCDLGRVDASSRQWCWTRTRGGSRPSCRSCSGGPATARPPSSLAWSSTSTRWMTGRVEQPSTPTADVRRTPASVPLPHASVDALSGLAEIMVPLGPLSVAELADELYLEVDDLLPLIDALELLELAQVEAGQMELTGWGPHAAHRVLPRCAAASVQRGRDRPSAGRGARLGPLRRTTSSSRRRLP